VWHRGIHGAHGWQVETMAHQPYPRWQHQPKQLQQGIPLAAKRVLTKQLGELEAAGFIYKRVYAEIPMRVEYFLTEIGESVYPIIQAMDQWGKSHRDLLEKK